MPSEQPKPRRYVTTLTLLLCFIHNSVSFTTLPSRTPQIVPRTNLHASIATPASEVETDEKQIVRLIDPRTNRPIILVGCMHYNPASIKLAEKTAVDAVNSLTPSPSPSFPFFTGNKKTTKGGLAAVLVESCRTRWDAANKFRSETLQETWQKDAYDKILPNEMRAAANVASSNGIPVVLGDQAIETTGERVKATLKETVKDLVTPWNGGWDRIGNDVKVGFGVISNSFGIDTAGDKKDNSQGTQPATSTAASAVAGRLTYRDFLDANLVTNMPVSLARYPLGILVRFPKFGLTLLSLFTAVDYISGQLMAETLSSTDPMMQTLVTSFVGAGSAVVDDSSPLSWTFTFLIALLETIVFARVFMLPILSERDVVLAKSIVATCAATGSTRASSEAVGLYRVILEDSESDGTSNSNGAVVAVLGAAHVNGVRDIILNGVEDDPILCL